MTVDVDVTEHVDLAQQMVPTAAALAVAVADRNYEDAVSILEEVGPRIDVLALVLASLVDVTKPLIIDPTLLTLPIARVSAKRSLRRIIGEVASVYNLEPEQVMQGSGRGRQMPSEARMVACWVAHAEGYSYPALGKELHQHHTTIMYGVRKVAGNPRLKAIATCVHANLHRGGVAA